jgi:hypothetical protein
MPQPGAGPGLSSSSQPPGRATCHRLRPLPPWLAAMLPRLATVPLKRARSGRGRSRGWRGSGHAVVGPAAGRPGIRSSTRGPGRDHARMWRAGAQRTSRRRARSGRGRSRGWRGSGHAVVGPAAGRPGIRSSTRGPGRDHARMWRAGAQRTTRHRARPGTSRCAVRLRGTGARPLCRLIDRGGVPVRLRSWPPFRNLPAIASQPGRRWRPGVISAGTLAVRPRRMLRPGAGEMVEGGTEERPLPQREGPRGQLSDPAAEPPELSWAAALVCHGRLPPGR